MVLKAPVVHETFERHRDAVIVVGRRHLVGDRDHRIARNPLAFISRTRCSERAGGCLE